MHQLHSVVSKVLSAVQCISDDDPITECYNDNCKLSALLKDHPDEALSLADKNLRVFPFKDVKDCWRRLFTDASVVKACYMIQAQLGNHNVEKACLSTENDECRLDKKNTEELRAKKEVGDKIHPSAPWLYSVIHILDKALIMTGAPGRESCIENLISSMQEATGPEEMAFESYTSSIFRASDEPQAKRRKLGAEPPLFPSDSVASPTLTCSVPRVSALSFEEFTEHMWNHRSPIVINDAVSHWPALSDRPWSSSEYWSQRTFGGRRLVPVEIGRSYTDEGWGQRIIPFGKFVKDYIRREEGKETLDTSENGELTSQESTEDQTGYLAQHDLLAQIPALRKDISVPDYCYAEPPGPERGTPVYEKKLQKREAIDKKATRLNPHRESTVRHEDDNEEDSEQTDPIINTWIGPAWTISPLHHDPYHNILVQVVGAKYIRLYSPHTPASQIYPRGMEIVNGSSKSKEMYGESQQSDRDQWPASSGDQAIDMSNTSKVDIAAIELSPAEAETWDSLWPGFAEAKYVETVLREGECLYIPVGWWHYVRSLQAGISVSFWWN
ncbi:hypothetical protein DIZ76_017245 [Coccidioides immitis]|nr:hypothetical protein DIZ76_017245 [Coccidioides immitis]